MSANKIYRTYKTLSADLFNPIKSDPHLSAKHYRRLSERYQRCARLRQAFQDNYVPEALRDDGHQQAVEAAIARSEEARQIYSRKLYERYSDVGCLTTSNGYDQLHHVDDTDTIFSKENEIVSPHVMSLVCSSDSSDSTSDEKIQNEDELLDEQVWKVIEEELNIALLIYSMLERFWSSRGIDTDDLMIMSLFTWTCCSQVPLRAKEFAMVLKKGGLVEKILKDIRWKDFFNDCVVKFLDDYRFVQKAFGFESDSIKTDGIVFGITLMRMREQARSQIDKKTQKKMAKLYRSAKWRGAKIQ